MASAQPQQDEGDRVTLRPAPERLYVPTAAQLQEVARHIVEYPFKR